MNTRCTTIRRDGLPCRGWAVKGTNPPRCAAHGGRTRHPTAHGRTSPLPGFDIPSSPGAIQSPKDAPALLTLGTSGRPLASLDDASELLAESVTLLRDYIRAHIEELTVDDMVRLFSVYGQNLSRYVRVRIDRARLAGDVDDELESAIQDALQLTGANLGVELLPRDRPTDDKAA